MLGVAEISGMGEVGFRFGCRLRKGETLPKIESCNRAKAAVRTIEELGNDR